MRFLLDMNVPRVLGERLRGQRHQCRHVGDIGLARADDRKIVEEAKAARETIITHDLDYGHLLAFSGGTSPSVIIFRLRNSYPDNLFARIMGTWDTIEKPLEEGAIVVLEDAVLRIRKLPVEPE
ncbi:MAG: DUF5615 family PIN-like protein [Anaerolineae bacterium]